MRYLTLSVAMLAIAFSGVAEAKSNKRFKGRKKPAVVMQQDPQADPAAASSPVVSAPVIEEASVAPVTPNQAMQAVTTDSRIRTLVYNANEVFTVTTHYGYQSNIEFGPQEMIETISVGDRVGWQISPAGRRLFIRAQEENAHTNMTVVTNQRAYQFDLRSSSANAVFGSEELTYVVRFFYPEEGMVAASPAPYVPPVPLHAAPVTAAMPQGQVPASPQPVLNYHYTYTGAAEIAPLKIFDDGANTYFKFPGDMRPEIVALSPQGETPPLLARLTPDGLLSVPAVAQRFRLTVAGQSVVVYNEASGVM